MHKYTIIVQTSASCKDLLHYVNKNIAHINSMGVRIRCEKISRGDFDEGLVEKLRRKGITRLPALITANGQPMVGLKRIIDSFENGINGRQQDERLGLQHDGAGEFGTNPDMTSFWMKELFAGSNEKGLIPRKDDEEDQDRRAGDEMQRRLADYQRKIPGHRQPSDAVDTFETPKRRPRNDYEDNIADEPPRPPTGPTVGIGGADDVDAKMLAAWLDNNNLTDY